MIGSIVYYSLCYGISPMPSSRKAVESILSELPTHLTGHIVDLGAGWGTLTIAVACRHPNCQIDSYEVSFIPWIVMSVRIWLRQLKNVRVVHEDFFTNPLDEASVVICYLYPGAMKKLKSKFEKELRMGTLIISNTFAIPGWKPQRVYILEDLYRTPIYVYRIEKKDKDIKDIKDKKGQKRT